MARILVVDDELAIRTTVRDILVDSGFAVTLASNGDEAMMEFQSIHYDLVLIDLIMPVIEGIEAIRAMIDQDPNQKIIAMSGGGRVIPGTYLRMAEQLGASAILAKPFNRFQLLTVIGRLLSMPNLVPAESDLKPATAWSR